MINYSSQPKITKTVDEYYAQQDNCSDLCNVTNNLIVERDEMKCVTCPFCKELVNAILTKTTISCPACMIEVKR